MVGYDVHGKEEISIIEQVAQWAYDCNIASIALWCQKDTSAIRDSMHTPVGGGWLLDSGFMCLNGWTNSKWISVAK